MLVESKKTGKIIEFTLEQWRNLEDSDHARNFKIIDAGILPKVEKIDIVKPFGEKSTTLTVEYFIDYKKLLDEAGIKYNKSIKNPAKLKELYEQNKPVVTTVPEKQKGE